MEADSGVASKSHANSPSAPATTNTSSNAADDTKASSIPTMSGALQDDNAKAAPKDTSDINGICSL
jgi:hypothetical protein